MNRKTEDDIIELIRVIYKIPGQYLICAIFSFALWNAMKHITPWAVSLLIFGIICIILEILSPIIAGQRLYDKALKNIKKIFG